MKLCKKEGCSNFSIPKGKYCNVHRSIKKRQINISENILNDRLLIEEQNKEYLKTLEADLKKFQEKEEEKIMFENNIQSIKKNIEKIDKNEKYFSVKVVFTEKNGFFYIFELYKYATTKDLYDLIDLFIYDNKIDYSNEFTLIYYPNIEINRDDVKNLEDVFNNKSFQLKIKTIEK